jgi:hypothetical protein
MGFSPDAVNLAQGDHPPMLFFCQGGKTRFASLHDIFIASICGVMKIEPVLRDNLSILAKTYCAHTGATLGVLSRRSHGDPPYFERLMAGEGTVSARAYDKLIPWFEKNWPKDVPVPVIWAIICHPPATRERGHNGTAKEGRSKAGKARSR